MNKPDYLYFLLESYHSPKYVMQRTEAMASATTKDALINYIGYWRSWISENGDWRFEDSTCRLKTWETDDNNYYIGTLDEKEYIHYHIFKAPKLKGWEDRKKVEEKVYE